MVLQNFVYFQIILFKLIYKSEKSDFYFRDDIADVIGLELMDPNKIVALINEISFFINDKRNDNNLFRHLFRQI